MKWTRKELKQIDQRIRKLMTIHKALHPRDHVDRQYVSRREGGRGFANIEESVNTNIQRLEDHKEKRGGRLITATRNNTNDTGTSGTTIIRKHKWKEKQLNGRLKLLTSDISHGKTWTWLKKGNLTRETKSLLIAAQNNAIRTNHIKARIDKTQQNM